MRVSTYKRERANRIKNFLQFPCKIQLHSFYSTRVLFDFQLSFVKQLQIFYSLLNIKLLKKKLIQNQISSQGKSFIRLTLKTNRLQA